MQATSSSVRFARSSASCTAVVMASAANLNTLGPSMRNTWRGSPASTNSVMPSSASIRESDASSGASGDAPSMSNGNGAS